MRLSTKQTLTLLTMALSVVMLSSCTQKLQSNLAKTSEKTIPVTPQVESNSCLLSGPSKIALGTSTALTLSYNFVVPDSAQLYWNGTNNGVAIARESYGQTNIYRWTFEYLDAQIAGNYSRYITVVDAAGKTLCTSNTLQVQLLPVELIDLTDDEYTLKAEANCTQLGGSVGISEGEENNCSVQSWTLYQKMDAKGLVKNITGNSSGLAMPNPASVNCANVGGTEANTATASICIVNKFTLLSNANVVDVAK